MGDPPRERLAGLTQKIDGGRTQEQELVGSLPLPAALVDDAPQGFEQPRHPVDLVQDDELLGVLFAELLDIRDACQIAGPLEVHMDGVPCRGHFARQSGLADLARTDQNDSGVPVEQSVKRPTALAFNHPCESNSPRRICIVIACAAGAVSR